MKMNELRELLKERYDGAIEALMKNDKNATWDEILGDYDNDIVEATKILISCLKRIIEEQDCDEEVIPFYKEILDGVNKI